MLEGGCLCGKVRYRIDGPPIDAGFCHCSTCRRSAGAPITAWGTWPHDAFTWTRGEPRRFQSSANAERGFCGDCGTQLTFAHTDRLAPIDVTLASLDDPEAVSPDHHGWTEAQLSWMQTADSLPRHPAGGPDSEEKSGQDGG